MFSELTPLLAERTVLITVAREDDRTIRVNVIPKQVKEGENAALTTPLTFVGTAEELDRDFARELAGYVETHGQLGSTLAQAKATMDAAAKAAAEEAKRKADERRKAKPSSPSPAPTEAAQSSSGSNSDPAPAPTANLFGEAPVKPGQPQQEGGPRL